VRARPPPPHHTHPCALPSFFRRELSVKPFPASCAATKKKATKKKAAPKKKATKKKATKKKK